MTKKIIFKENPAKRLVASIASFLSSGAVVINMVKTPLENRSDIEILLSSLVLGIGMALMLDLHNNRRRSANGEELSLREFLMVIIRALAIIATVTSFLFVMTKLGF